MMEKHMDESWYDISLESLGCSEDSITILTRIGLSSVGDCVDYLYHMNSSTINMPSFALSALFDEVVPQLAKSGYIKDDLFPKTSD